MQLAGDSASSLTFDIPVSVSLEKQIFTLPRDGVPETKVYIPNYLQRQKRISPATFKDNEVYPTPARDQKAYPQLPPETKSMPLTPPSLSPPRALTPNATYTLRRT